MNWAAVRSVFPVTSNDIKDLREKPDDSQYDAFFALMNDKSRVCSPNEPHTHTKLMVTLPAAYLPRYLFTLQKTSIPPLSPLRILSTDLSKRSGIC